MKKINISLIIGIIIVLGVMFLIFFGKYYAPYDASVGEQSSWVLDESGQRVFKRAPFGPDQNHLLGTDNGGRDVLSIIMEGAKNTFFIVFIATLLRFLVAIPIAYLAAFGEKISKNLILIFSSTFNAVPGVLICIMILKTDDLKKLDLLPSMIAFIIVFTIVGWGRLASNIQEKIRDILDQDFIQGSVAVGKSKFAIATQNIASHILPSIIVYLFLEIALVLLLLAQLGIFEVFVGNKQTFAIDIFGSAGRTNFNFFPEWGSMLASTKRSIVGIRFWLALYPIIAFSISIIGFNLLGEGLNHELNKRNSMFISNVNKLWFHLSPITYINEIKNFKDKRKIVIGKTLGILTIILLVLIPNLNSTSIVDNSVMAYINEINKDDYEGRLTGTSGNELFSDYIINQLKDYKISPLFGESYINEFNIDPTINIINESNLIIKDNLGEIIDEIKYKVDYSFEGWTSNSMNSLEGEILTSESYLEGKFDSSKEYFLVLNADVGQSYIYDKIVSDRKNHEYIKAVLVTNPRYSIFPLAKMELENSVLTRVWDKISAFDDDLPPVKIQIGKRATGKLWKLEGSIITLDINMDNPQGLIGKNIGGIIEGKEPENPIIIVTSYDYLGVHDLGVTQAENLIKFKGLYENGTSIATNLEIAKNLGDIRQIPNRSIIFLFIDGTKLSIEGIQDIEKQGLLGKQPLLIYLNYMGINPFNKKGDSLYYYTILNKTNSKEEQEFFRWFKRNTTSKNHHIMVDYSIKERSLTRIDDNDMVGIILQGLAEKEKSWYDGNIQSNMESIHIERLTAHIQYLLDTIIDMAYRKIWIK